MKFLDDVNQEPQLFPFTLTRSVADIRIGILTIREKWLLSDINDESITVQSNLLPSAGIIESINSGKGIVTDGEEAFLRYPWNIFQFNDRSLRYDFDLLTKRRSSQPLSLTNQVISPGEVFLEEGAKVEHCIINASTGPVYLGKNSTVMEGSTIRGPFALCEGGVIKMGAKIYGATTIGPYCIAGGEIKNSVMFGYSNKAHDGYLGDSVIGEWCNLGAGTSTSNLKNSAGEIRVHTGYGENAVVAGIKCGLMMGDYTRSAINTSFNSGTITGVSCNIFGEGLTPSYIPSFSWGLTSVTRYTFDKAIRDIQSWKQLKNQSITEKEITILKHIFDQY